MEDIEELYRRLASKRKTPVRDLPPEERREYMRRKKQESLRRQRERTAERGYPTSTPQVREHIVDTVFELISRQDELGVRLLEELSNRFPESGKAKVSIYMRAVKAASKSKGEQE